MSASLSADSAAVMNDADGLDEDVFIFPASFAQQRLWFLDQLEPGTPLYNIPSAVRLSGALDVEALQRSLDEIVERHESLRTTFAAVDGQPVQVIAPAGASVSAYSNMPIRLVDLRDVPEDRREAQALRLAAEEARRPFDLARGPLLRVALLRLDESEYVVLLTMHHIISDGWSMGVLVAEIAALYDAFARGRPSPLSALAIQYADFAAWQREWLQGQVLEQQLAYWKGQLGGSSPVLALPTDRPRSSVQSSRGGSQSIELPKRLLERLKEVSRQSGATLFMTLLAAFQTLLYRYSGQNDISVGSPIANRNRGEIEPLIGFFVNTLVLRADLSGNPTFRELLARVRAMTLGAYAHQDVPFEMVVDAVQPVRDLSLTPLFQVMFILQNATAQVQELPGLTLRPLDTHSGTSTFDITLSMSEGDSGLDASIEYSADLFDDATIARMLGHFKTLLEAVAVDHALPVSTLPLLTVGERRQLLVEWNDTAAPYELGRCIHQLFEAQAARTPDATAVAFGAQRLTYCDLNGRANQLARHLRSLGVGAETLVGLCVERSLEMIVGALGILKAGGAYLPLDPAYPAERLQYMLADAQVAVLLTDQDRKGVLHRPPANDAGAHSTTPPADSGQPTVIDLVAEWETLARQPETNLDSVATADNLAYMIYTSGSTGQSKGVMLPHRNLVNAYLAWEDAYELRGAARSHLQMASFSFDVFTADLVRALCSGGKLVICPRELLLEPEQLYDLMRREQVDCAEFVPVVLRGLVAYLEQRGRRLDFMRVLICGSDTWYVREYRQFQQLCGPQTRLINSFGLTEATVDSTYFERAALDLAGDQLVPIGRPFANMQLYILDSYGQPVPAGVPGELCIGGAGLARGYRNRPDLTAERFVPNPFVQERLEMRDWRLTASTISNLQSPISDRLYRTGDLARYLPDGNVEFLGRIDQQVKIRGFRIEPGEIEAVLEQHPAVREAVVLARNPDVGRGVAAPGDTRLVAYIVPDQEQRTKPVLSEVEGNKEQRGEEPHSQFSILNSQFLGELRQFIRDRLPDYMTPAAFVLLDALPVTPNGKIDRQALPAPDWSLRALAEDYVAPRTPVEETLAGVWAQVLGLPQVGIHDNFFEIGGHSLLATRLISRLREVFQVEVPLRTLFEAPTIAAQATQVEHARRTPATQAPPLRPLPRNPDGGRGDGALPLSFAQQRLWFLDQLEPDSPFYNIPEAVRLAGPLDVDALQRSLDEIVRRHESLRTTFVTMDGKPSQVIGPVDTTMPIRPIDLRLLPVDQREVEAQRLATEEVQRPFDLARGPLLRALLLRLGDEDHLILLTLHHIISDGWSTSILTREVGILYDAFSHGRSSPLPALPIQYADFAAWQRGWLHGAVQEQQLAYWKQQLAGLPPLLELPTDRSRPPVQTYQGAYRPFVLPRPLSDQIRALSQREGATLFMTLLAAFQALLARYSGQDDISVGTPIAGRTRAELEGLIGFFVNTLVLRADLSGDPSFSQLLGRVREAALGAYAHQDLPFEMIVDALQPDRNLGHSPFFQVMFVLQNADQPEQTQESTGLTLNSTEVHSGTSKFDLTLFMTEEGQQLGGALEYNTDLFDTTTIERMIGHFETLLAAIAIDPALPVSKLPLLTGAERRQLLVEWNATAAPYPHELCVHQLFEAQAERTPHADAVVFGAQRLSYRELNGRANQLAHHLRTLGIGPELLVGVCIERSLELAVALLGILKAGAAYLPLDPAYPAERLRFMLDDAQVSVLLTSQEQRTKNQSSTTDRKGVLHTPLADHVEAPSTTPPPAHTPPADDERAYRTTPPADLAQLTVIDLDGEWETIAQQPATNPASAATPDNLAYVIYTSGSTGTPKGAMIVHRGLTNYLAWATRAYAVEGGRGAPVHSSISFDLTITGLFAPLLAGRAVHLLPEQLGVETLSEALATTGDFSLVKITPAHLELLGRQLGPSQAGGRTRAFIIGGEQLLAESIAFWRRHAPATLLVNEYGPTETVVGCCVYTVSAETPPSGAIPIGRPIANTELYVLDRRLEPVPIGVPGELYIGGAGVARGYLGRPELTAERFVPCPWSVVSGPLQRTTGNGPLTTDNRLYKTGDLCRYRPDGVLEYLGRIDHQVKVRGFRIELGEIEAVLAQHPGLREAAVVVREDTPGDRRLVAYVVAGQEQRTKNREQRGEEEDPQFSILNSQFSIQELRGFLKDRLPDYMVPAAFVLLDALPLTSNGKVDRKALPAPDGARPDLASEYVAPRTPAETALADISGAVAWRGAGRGVR